MTLSLARYGSYRAHDHYQRQRVLQKERAIVSGVGRGGLAPSHELIEAAVAPVPAHSLIFLDIQHRKREG